MNFLLEFPADLDLESFHERRGAGAREVLNTDSEKLGCWEVDDNRAVRLVRVEVNLTVGAPRLNT